MDLSAFFQQMKDARKDDPMFQSAKIAADRVKNQSPFPENPEPVENEFAKSVAGSVAGSLAPGGSLLSEAEQALLNQKDLLRNIAARQISQPNALAMPTQIANRAIDFAERKAAQLAARRKSMVGR